MENINITAENSVGHCWAKSSSYLAHPCQAVPGVLCHLHVSGFRGFVLFGEEHGLAAEVHGGVRGGGWYRYRQRRGSIQFLKR